ncbi:unnamed protein product [Clonostachys byssicola]|uniref:NACHT domain-containing protein n=1 Tax=Clonostachys byssicola TaxID=160290 RepID=A0A9N9UV00_9HYPO|nr:unnamed protein product [Clonostachys byssicola]
MTSYEIDYVNSDSDVDAVVIDRDDVSNYNPEQILPQPAEIIQKIRAWLQPTSYDIAGGEYRKHLASHVSGTGSWLTESDTYKQWLEDDSHGLLWIKGIPGSGKSVMAASLIDGFAKASPGSPVVFFFFRQIIEANHQPEALLRDWMDQILTYSPPLQKKLNDYLESRRSIESISMEDMWKDLYMAFSGLSKRVFCVADALDEMDKGNESFLQALATLGKWNPQKVKVLITSRPVPTIEGPLRAFQSSCLQIRLQENMVDIDIATFVQFSLSRSTIPQADWKTIMDAVPGRANGLFLYAKLAMDAFLEPGADVKAVLGHLPADLNVLYTDLLKEHSRRSGIADSVQRLILQAVTHSTRPLRLLELAEMIKANNPDGKERDLKATKDLIRAACGPLLEILADETVSVIHHSFTEYLKGTTRPGGSGYPVLEMGPTHAQLAIACLRYLTSGSLKSIVVEEEEYNGDSDGDWYRSRNKVPKEEIQQRLKHPFFEYAAVNWAHHIRRSEAAKQDQTEVLVLVREFLDNERDMKAWLQAKWNASSRGATQGVTKIHIAAKLGLCSYLKEIIQTMEPDVPDSTGRTPLWWAAREGHEEAVHELIKAGANPDQPESVRGLKPLHEAANLNHHAVVRALLEAGVDPLTPKTMENPGRRCGNAPRTVGHTPLMYACQNGHLESVDAFLPFLKDIDTAHRALAWSASEAKSKVVARILQHPGIDVNAKVRGNTALYLACGTSDVETIRCLLEAGADPRVQSLDSGDEFNRNSYYVPFGGEKQNPNRNNCLHRLCGSGRRGYMDDNRNTDDLQTIFSLLINAGADINSRDPSGQTPLHNAVSSPVLIRLLLRAGADANVTDNSGIAPIHLVKSMDSMVILIEEGHADIDLAQKDGKTPLLNMVSTYHVENTLKFLEYGPDINATDREGDGVLHVALKQWNTGADVLKALLKAGANPNAKNKAGLTPLLSKRGDFKPQLLDILIEGGADVNATDRQGRTVLFNVLGDFISGSDGKYEHITQVVERGFSIHHRDWKGRTLLHEAVLLHDANRVRPSQNLQFDFVHGLGLDVHAVDHDGNGLLHELAMRSANHESYSGPPLVSLWERLLELGLDLEQTNHDGLTPLHILCSANTSSSRFEQGVIMPIDFVISGTKDLDRIDNLGATALHRAVIHGELYSKKLLDAGADPAKATHEGLTPLHIASRCRQSNVVGLLLDELRKRTPSSDSAVLGVNAAAPSKNNLNLPLYYACLSGRPETVSLLFDAGADPKKAMVLSACASFEDEDQLWNTACQEDDIFKDQLPLRLKDTRRIPTRGDRYGNASGLKDDETTRLEEILEMCANNGLGEDDFKELDPRFHKSGYIGEAFNKGHDYTAICLTAIRAKNPAPTVENDEKAAPSVGTGRVEEILHNSSREARLQSLGASGMLQPDKINQHHFLSFLRRKEWKFIEKMAHEGVDFLNASLGVSNFASLVSHGYTSLAETVGDIVVQKGFESGDWHAFGDNTRPGLWFAKRDISDPSKVAQNPLPLLIGATQRELPNLPMVKLLVEKFGVDVNEMQYSREYANREYIVGRSNSPIHSVSRGDHWWQVHQALPYLLKAGADIHLRNHLGQTPLLTALKAGGNWPGPFNKTAARLLIEAGADVNAIDKEGRSCLACARHDVDVVKLLISHGADVTADSVLAAIDSKSVPMLQALLSGGASANIRADKPSEEALAAERKKRNNRYRWAYGSSIHQHERFPLFHAGSLLDTLKPPATSKEHRETETCIQLVQVLLEHGADPFDKFLIETSSGPDTTTEEATVLHELLADGSLPEIYLRIPDLDIGHRDADGRTLLHAVCSGVTYPDYVMGSYQQDGQVGEKTTVFQHLLSLGADIEAVDNSSRNVLHYMIGNPDRHGFVEFDRFEATLAEALEKAPQLMNQPDSSGETPLHAAVLRGGDRGRPDIAQTLLKAGADHLTVTKKGNNLLHSLAPRLRTEQNRDFFEDLVKRGVDINARNIKGETPLFTFCVKSKAEKRDTYSEKERAMEKLKVIPLLERLGADLFVKDNRGRGLLHAAAGGSVDIFKQLMERGLDVMLEDEVQQTAIDVAAACGNKDILELFEKKI